jgi:signal transduction histidine kinase
VSVDPHQPLPNVLRRIVACSRGLVGARYGALGVTGPDGKLAEFVYDGIDEEASAEIGGPPRCVGLLGELMKRDEPLRLADLEADPHSFGFPSHHPPMRTFLGVPVHVRGEVFGNLCLTDKLDGGEFTEADEEVVVAIAEAAGLAIENARMYEQIRQREVWLRASNEVTRALLTGTSGRDALALVAARARAAADGSVAALVLPDGSGDLVLEVVDGARGHGVEGIRAPRQGRSWQVFSTGEPVQFDELGPFEPVEGGACEQMAAELSRLGPTVLVPMAAGERVLGVLLVARARDERSFSDADVQLLESFAEQATLVLEFTRGQEDSQRLAVLEDRDRIARDLHDLVIQRLFGLGLGLQGLNGLVVRPVVAARLAGFVDEVDQTIREIRRTIFSLQEPPASAVSLRGQLLRAVQESAGLLGYEPTVAMDGPLDSVVPDHVRPDLLATVREALANVARHADAHAVNVDVTVDRAATQLQLVVRDDGQGLPGQGPGPGAKPRRTGGLVNMAARATRWQGRCSIESARGKGVTVTWSVPLPG